MNDASLLSSILFKKWESVESLVNVWADKILPFQWKYIVVN